MRRALVLLALASCTPEVHDFGGLTLDATASSFSVKSGDAVLLESAGVPVETLYVRTEGHGFYSDANRRTYYTRLLDFLSRHLGGAKAK